MVMSRPVAAASRAISNFQSHGRCPFDPPPSAADEQPSRVGVLGLSHLFPPLLDGGDREDGGVVIDTDGHPGAVIGDVVDAVWDGLALGQAGEVVGGHLLGLTAGLPLPPGLVNRPTNSFFLVSTLITGSPAARNCSAREL